MISDEYQGIDFPPLRNCKCGAKAYIDFPCYANEQVYVYCEEECGQYTGGAQMGWHHEGTFKVIDIWNTMMKHPDVDFSKL